MDPGYLVLLLLTVFAIGASILFHLRGRGFFLASFTSAITAICTLLLIDTIVQGRPDTRLPIAFVLGAVYSFLVSMVVGWIIRWRMARRKDHNDQDSSN